MEIALPFFQLEWLNLSDEKLAAHVLALWIAHQSALNGVHPHLISEDIALTIVNKTPSCESDRYIELERIFQVIASGDLSRGGRLFRNYMAKGAVVKKALDEAVTGKMRQKSNAQKTRYYALESIIEEIVSSNPNIKHPALLEELRERESEEGTISEVCDDEKKVYWRPGSGKTLRHTPFKKLYPLLSRAKNKISS